MPARPTSVAAVVRESDRPQPADPGIVLGAGFRPVAGLRLHAPVRVVADAAGVPEAPATIRFERPDAQGEDRIEELLRLGYRVRQAADGAGGRPAFFVRAPELAPSSLLLDAGLDVTAGVHGGFDVEAEGPIRVGREARWTGDLVSAGDVWLEPGAVVEGDVRAAGSVVLEEGASVMGELDAGTLRFGAEEAPRAEASTAEWPLAVLVPPRTLLVEEEGREPEPEQPAIDLLAFAAAQAQTPPPPETESRETPLQGHPTFDWDAPFPGRYRVVAKVLPDEAAMPPSLRPHLPDDGLLEVEVVEANVEQVTVLLHPGTARERRVVCPAEEAAQDAALRALLPVLPRVHTLRMVYGHGVLGVRASADSIRWLITLFGKVLSLESRLGRLEQMRIFTEPEAGAFESAFLDPHARAAD